jgi:hypothetical protein
MEEVILPIRVAKFLGCHTAVLTNAAGGINHDFHLGDLMLITGEAGGGKGDWVRGFGYGKDGWSSEG